MAEGDLRDIALGYLRSIAGDGAAFHRDQFEAIEALVAGSRRLLLVQRTGWGKSAVYFIATKLLRDRGSGPTLLISPLLVLMRDQIRAAQSLDLTAETINSTNKEDWERVFQQLTDDEVDLLLISPERLNNEEFREQALGTVLGRVGLVVVDEAHCISDWGHDFRPDYRRIRTVVTLLPKSVPALLTTATANDRVIADIVEQLGDGLEVFRGPLARESLRLGVVDIPDEAERLAWLASVIPHLEGSGIVYCLTIAATRLVADWLNSRGISAAAYSGREDTEYREDVETQLASNSVKAVVATSALGMGYDKPDLAWVIHYQSPGSPVLYYQQVGRAGRQLDKAYGILIRGGEDADIQDHFITTAFPTKDEADRILAAVSEGPLTRQRIAARVNLRVSRIDAFLKILEVGGAVARDSGKWTRTIQPWEYPTERVGAVTKARRAEQRAMRDYAGTDRCYMAFLTALLNDPDTHPCGRCANCKGRTVDPVVPQELAVAAEQFLRRQHMPLEPRKQWPSGFRNEHDLEPLSHHRLEQGYALCRYGSGVWGPLITAGKYRDGSFSSELTSALAETIENLLGDAGLEWVTSIPSFTRPGLVKDFAASVAERLGLPYLDLLEKRPAPPQKDMQNSFRQASNALAGLAMYGTPPGTPGLLIDDITDSRWTLTVAGYLLLSAGAGPLYPVVLADASHS
jgi:ATP-dependent DNA helicase RecQ